MMARTEPRGEVARRRRGGRGVSVIEMLLATMMLVLVVVPILSMHEGSTRIFARGDAAAGMHQDLRRTIGQMVRELRMAGYDPSVTASPAAFEVATAATVRFIADADTDGTTERIEYAYDAAARTVTRQFWVWDGAAWGPGSGPLMVAREVDGLTFAYFDATDGAPAGLVDIRRVTVAINASHLVPGYGLERYTLVSEARARNLL